MHNILHITTIHEPIKSTGVINEAFPRHTGRGYDSLPNALVGTTLSFTISTILEIRTDFQFSKEGAVVMGLMTVYMH